MTSLGEMYTHQSYFGRSVAVNTMDEVKNGDVIQFQYGGKSRWVYVLNPNWEGKVHCLALEHVPRRVLLGEVVSFTDMTLNGGLGPKEFYDKNIGTRPVKEFDAYRTFIIEKMQKIQKVEYVISQVTWTPPNITEFAGALGLAAMRFGIDAQTLIDETRKGFLMQWPDRAWSRLKNSQSLKIPLNGFFEISRIYGGGTIDEGITELENAFKTGGEITAPIVLFIGDQTEQTPYLVSGELKMMYAHAAGVLPRVWLVTLPTAG